MFFLVINISRPCTFLRAMVNYCVTGVTIAQGNKKVFHSIRVIILQRVSQKSINLSKLILSLENAEYPSKFLRISNRKAAFTSHSV